MVTVIAKSNSRTKSLLSSVAEVSAVVSMLVVLSGCVSLDLFGGDKVDRSLSTASVPNQQNGSVQTDDVTIRNAVTSADLAKLASACTSPGRGIFRFQRHIFARPLQTEASCQQTFVHPLFLPYNSNHDSLTASTCQASRSHEPKFPRHAPASEIGKRYSNKRAITHVPSRLPVVAHHRA